MTDNTLQLGCTNLLGGSIDLISTDCAMEENNDARDLTILGACVCARPLFSRRTALARTEAEALVQRVFLALKTLASSPEPSSGSCGSPGRRAAGASDA